MTTSSDPQPQQQEGPERIWIYGGPKYGRMIAYTNPARWVGSLQPVSGYTEYVRVDLPRATAGAELTVESALKELREMFPVPPLKIVKITEWTIAGRRVRWNVEINQFCISSLFGDVEDSAQPGTLERAMIAVRAWSKSRAATSEGEIDA